jgi:hypothetical protein
MSNELTPQEQYPKFYSDPHLWIGAIEVEVNCDTTGTYRQIKKGEIFQLSALTLHEFQLMSALQNLTPKFESQEGDQFIKDLESAVSAGNIFNYKLSYKDKDKNGHYLFTGDKDGHPLLLMVNSAKLSMVAYAVGEDLIALPFNTAAYVDTLRKLGYYL